MATPASIPANCSRDTVQSIHRLTRGNRSLWYQMTVLQQPERARACGSGMKANSDRRPVDPPPVVELRIIEGPSIEEGKDVTFDYNANFFLYASLEQARPIAPGRGQPQANSNPPILTGVPASGMAYLDRPAEAGYFIFPDLSVRHEGYFRLCFSLFETTKEERDFDIEPDSELPTGVDWRMEIKTLPFNVYSAKKFPGLMESTQLSKTVADQGCRVRIRRDVRMRKRDGKSAGYERRDDDFSRRRTGTPVSEDSHGIRPRSLSSSSEHRAAYRPGSPRRPSAVDVYSQRPPPPPPPGYEAAPPPSRSHLSFGEPLPPTPYAASRHYPQPGPGAMPATGLPGMGAAVGPGPGAPIAAGPAPEPGAAMSGPTPSPRRSYQPLSQPSSGTYPPSNPSPYGYSHGRTLSSASPSPALSAKHKGYDRSPSGYAAPSLSPYPSDGPPRRDSHASYHAAPSSQPPPVPRSTTHSSLAPLKIASLVSPLPPIEAQTEPPPAAPVAMTGGKRKHENVFSQSAQPLHNGQRQVDPHFGRRGATAPDPDQGSYSRADGKVGVVTFSQWQ